MSNSDYKKPRTNLYNLLPDVFKTKVNKSILENIHNRYLTKTELVPSFGSVGKRNPSVSSDNRLAEPTVHRQAWQLQPLLYSKIATAEHISSYHDILRSAERLGIDIDRLPKWGNALKFNFAPPISIDKLINYQDYYWYDQVNRNSKPQYITILNACAVASNRQTQLEMELDRVIRNPASSQANIEVAQQNVDEATVERDCVCSGGGVGWDRTGWDDSGGNWWLGLPTAPTHTPPIAGSGDTFVYFDTVAGKIKVWDNATASWIDAAQPSGIFPWDTSDACVTQVDPWSKENKWIHKSAVNDSLGGLVRRAEMPIIEYNPYLELNEWVYVAHQWKYRASNVSGWVDATSGPSDLEMAVRYNILTIDNINNEIYIAGNHTAIFVPGFVFATEDPTTYENTLWTVNINGYDSITNRTVIRLVESVIPLATTHIIAPISATSLGDQWQGFFFHWMYAGSSQSVPTNNQYANPNVIFNENLSTSTNATTFATPEHFLVGADVIRVYANGIRQFGNYIEGYLNGTIFTAGAGVDGIHANAIQFFVPRNVPETIRIETNPAALSDINRKEVQIRNTTTSSFVPETVALINYRKVEQVKNEVNQYPLFNIFNVDGTPAHKANPIFIFQESSKYPVDLRVNRRIITSNAGKEFYFEQQLIDEDNGSLYCYKDINSIELTNVEGLQTIWRKGLNNEEYVPRYVNQYRLANGDEYLDSNKVVQVANVTPGGTDYTTSGDWEVADQVYYNTNHENRKLLKLTDLVSHFNTIIQAQQPDAVMSFLQDQTTIVGTLTEYNFGVGGSIKEFNDSFDTFLSAMYQDTNNPISITNFARIQYDNNITTLQEMFVQHAVEYLSKGTTFEDTKYIWDQDANIANDVIAAFEFNDAYDFAFGDTTAYNKNNTGSNDHKIGIKNWIATLPLLRLAKAIEPQLLVDSALNIKKIRHHDGHITDVVVDSRTVSNITTQLLVATGGTSGTSFPTTGLTKGMYWKNTTTNKLYRFNVVAVSPSPPGIVNPLGSFWLNTNTDTLYIRDGSITGWSIYTGSANDAWKEIIISDIVAHIILEVEHRLYRAVPEFTDFSFDYNTLIPPGDVGEQQVFVDYLKQAYFDFIQQHQLNPFVTDFIAGDAFTWNYGGIDPTMTPIRYPTTGSLTTKPWSSRWNTIYQSIYGTQYPHLEPWKLQGYTTKPTWWDSEYKDTSGNRRWVPTMWTNIGAGSIPAGKTPPVGAVTTYSHFCVNIYGITIDGYAPDDLIPPYYSNDITLKQQSLIDNYSYIPVTKINPNDIIISSMYLFGDQGPTEQAWRESIEFYYDVVKIAFKMQPVRFLHYAMGFEFYHVAGLQVEKNSKKVLSHKNMVFHGDLVGGDIYQSHGFGQWYTNFIRFGAYDMNTSDFKTKWVEWDPLLAYQTASFINAKSLQLASKYFDITKQDYKITTKKTPGFADYWMDSLFITTHKVGSWNTYNNTKIPRGDGYDWEFRVEISSPVGRKLSYYNVKKYQFIVNVDTNVCTTMVGMPWDDQTINYSHTYEDTNTWNTGTAIYISSTGANPVGANEDRVYFLIKLSNDEFKLADSLTNATEGVAIDLTTEGIGDLFIGEVQQTFNVTGMNNTVTWTHFKKDKRTINTIQTPHIIKGIQNLVDFIDGYAEYYRDQGFIFNDTNEITEVDLDTGKPLNWQVEIERLISRIYTGLGDVGQVVSYDQPNGGEYTTADSSTWITRQNNISEYHEVNPFRNNIWFNNKVGVVSDIIFGPFDEVSSIPLIYDHNGQGTTADKLFIYREDSKCQITLCSLCGSVYDGEDAYPRPYGDIHMSGVHLFIDTYEHIVLFNNYTIENNLLYDSFIGLNVGKLSVEFEKHSEPTFRPNVGGYFLSDNQLEQNIEYSIENMKYYYDTHIVNETADYLDYARALLGYEDPTYLDQVNAGAKSKFIFWKGMLQHKGSINSIKAFINSKLFIDAKIDEFWAYKIAEYGNVDETFFPEVRLKIDDVFKNELRLHFTSSDDLLQQTFKSISFEDETRWVDLPDLKALLGVYRNMRYGWDLPIWDNLTGVEWDSSFPAVENLFFDAEYSDYTEFVPTSDYVRLPTSCDGVSILVNNGTEMITLVNTGSPLVLPFAYIPHINNIDVYLDGIKLEATIGFDEVDSHTVTILATGSDVKIIKRVGKLIKNINYTTVNSYVIKLLPITTLVEFGTLAVYTINPAKQLQNAGKLVDMKAKSIVAELPIWDPIHGHQYHNADVIIDIKNDTDVAIYSTALDENINTNYVWNSQHVGKVWMDTKDLDYIPYHDIIIYPNINDRMSLWGKMAGWCSTNFYEWTESDVLPSNWDAVALDQQNDATVPQSDKKTGTPRKVLYRRTRTIPTDSTSGWGGWSIVNNPQMTIYGYTNNLLVQTLVGGFTGTNGSKVDVYSNGVYKGETTVMNITSTTETIPPTSPIIGELYVVALGGTAAWVGLDGQLVEWDGTNWIVNTTPILYVSGIPQIYVVPLILVINDYDTIRFIEELHLPNEETSTDILSSSTDLVEYRYSTPYVEVSTINNIGGITSTKYYFWVKNKTNKPNNRLYSLDEAIRQFKSPSVSYMFFQNFIEATESMPDHYSQVIVRGIANQITDDERYVLRFTKDYSMRDEYSIKNSNFSRKNIHQEWAVFRKEQESRIPRDLWNNVTESATGHPLTKVDDTHYTMDTTALIPSLERTHYDITHGTVTRFGLGSDQTFSDKEMTLNTVVSEIQNPNYDLYPISREVFFATYSFDTAENTKLAMDYIYNSFPYQHVNRIFFSVLYDALSLKAEYADMFKTSTIALHGVRLFETADRVIDD